MKREREVARLEVRKSAVRQSRWAPWEVGIWKARLIPRISTTELLEPATGTKTMSARATEARATHFRTRTNNTWSADLSASQPVSRLAAQHGRGVPGGRGHGGLADGGDLLGLERAVLGAQPEREGQGLRALLDLLALVQTSNRRTDSSSCPAPSISADSTSAAGTSRETTSATSTAATGKAATSGPVTCASVSGTSASRLSSIAQVRSGRPSASITRGCSSPA